MKSWCTTVHDPVANRRPGIAVALLYDATESGAQMRAALATLGADIVYEASTRELDRSALARSQATVVVIDLDARNGAGLGEVHDLLDHEQYRVVFNDGEVSSGLAGWDRARWQRHLAAKIFGDGIDTDPPRPAGARAVPARAETQRPLAEVAPAPLDGRQEPPERAAVPAVESGFGVAAVMAVQTDEPSLIDFDRLPAAPDFDAPAVLAASDPLEVHGAVLETLDLIDFPGLDVSVELPPPYIAADLPSVEELDALVAADGEPALIERTHTMDLEFDGAFAVEADREDAGATAAGAPAPAAADWTLDGLLDDLAEPPPAPASSAFGIEVIQPAEFLAPAAEEGAAPVDEPLELALELIPLEEAVAPTPVEQAARETWLESAAQAAVRRVWVLGASVGGPESVREFLAALPRDYPALFLLAQHLGDEFVDMMARQLAKATPLTVRTPTHGERVGHGEVVIVPATQRLLVDADGVVVLKRDAAETTEPLISRVIKDCAEQFGPHAGAIIFSGMGDDAIDGCRDLAAKGGKVYVQRPDTCVVSTMVDAVCDEGLADYIGSPQELAERLRTDAA